MLDLYSQIHNNTKLIIIFTGGLASYSVVFVVAEITSLVHQDFGTK